nr:hypothetical protein CFP56_39274 [Quercus suber]
MPVVNKVLGIETVPAFALPKAEIARADPFSLYSIVFSPNQRYLRRSDPSLHWGPAEESQVKISSTHPSALGRSPPNSPVLGDSFGAFSAEACDPDPLISRERQLINLFRGNGRTDVSKGKQENEKKTKN